MKRFYGLLAICAVILCAGCSGVKNESSSLSEIVSSSTSEAISSEPDDISYEEILPKWADFFPDGELNVIDGDGGTAYSIQVKNVTEEQAKGYVEECRNLDFKHGPKTWNTDGMSDFLENSDAEDTGAYEWSSDGRWHYEAYSGDKLYVLIIDMHTDEAYISITVRYKG